MKNPYYTSLMIQSFFSLRKSRKTLRQVHRLYKRKKHSLDTYAKESIQSYMNLLREAILAKNFVEAKKLSKEIEAAALRLMPKTLFDKVRDFTGGMLFALFVAVLIRTMWFELYTIPTGSMRPTLKEEDYLVVSKTDFGINVPLQEAHFYFDPTLVQRGTTVVFNAANIDIEDSDTTYFFLFPGKKQFVKRLIGKPGDTIYFYGGQIYGVDQEGKEIEDFRHFKNLEHIPFIRFDGKVETPNHSQGKFSPAIFHQMNQPVAKLSVTPIGTVAGEMLGSRQGRYFDLWGMKHYAMARLLSENGTFYLELIHHPTLQGAKLGRDEFNRLRPELATSTSLIPLQEKHLQELAKHLTTCRFKVENGVAYRYGWNPKTFGSHLPKLPGVPDGTYEIQDGVIYKLPFPTIPIFGVFTNGYSYAVDKSHPLYRSEHLQTLFNLGFEFLDYFSPTSKQQKLLPSRYAYFRDGDLYLMGAPVIFKEDPVLVDYVKREEEKKAISTTLNPYFPFLDQGPPSREEILKYGIKVPEKMYMALGDNHAMSADSRQFGFVPEDNLKGTVSFIFAPLGHRIGAPEQPSGSHFTFPNLAVWTGFLLAMLGSSIYYRRKLKAGL